MKSPSRNWYKMAEEMADGLSTINVDQLSRDVNAIVQAAAGNNRPFEDDVDTSQECCQPTSSGQDNFRQLFLNTSAFLQPSPEITGQRSNDCPTPARNLGTSEKLLLHQLNKGSVFVVPSQYSGNSSNSNSFLQQQNTTSQHLQPILPAPLRTEDSTVESNVVPSGSTTSHIVSESPQMVSDAPFTSPESSAVMSSVTASNSGTIAGINSSDMTFPSNNLNVAIHLPGMNQTASQDHIQNQSVTASNQRDSLPSLNPHGQLDIQVPPQGHSQLLNSLSTHSAQNLLSQMALFSPGNQDVGTSSHLQPSHLPSLLSPHSQSTLLPYLLRHMQSPGQSSNGIIDLSLLPDSNVSCSQGQEVTQTSREMSFQEQDMMRAVLSDRTDTVPLQAYKQLQGSQDAVNIDLQVQTNNSMEPEQEISTIAPSIITSSIHSLCMPTSGATTSTLNSTSLTVGVNSQVNVMNPDLLQDGTQLSRILALKNGNSAMAQTEVDLQSLAMQLSEIGNDNSRERHTQVVSQGRRHNAEEEFWCVQCDETMPQVCPQHGAPTIISDTPIQKRAKMTLPQLLFFKKSNVSSDFLGVWAKDPIKVGCRFGPLEGIILKRLTTEADSLSPLLWKVFQNGKVRHFIDAKDEDTSNWMMYVKRARKLEEQNLSAHQTNGQIYFTTKREIKSGEELLFWYSKDYATMSGATLLPEDSFKCHLCGRQFSYRQELDGHMRYRHPSMSERKFKCEVCSQAFTTSTKLNLHSVKHTGDKRYPCKICHKSFTDGSNLRRHTRIHSGEKKYQCSICGMSFRQKAHLVTHTLIHTGEKKLKCQYCGKMFARKSDIKQHMVLHSQEKQHACSICTRSFIRSQHLKNHMLTHTKERNFVCTFCKKTYQTSTHLQRHSKTCRSKLATSTGKRDRQAT